MSRWLQDLDIVVGRETHKQTVLTVWLRYLVGRLPAAQRPIAARAIKRWKLPNDVEMPEVKPEPASASELRATVVWLRDAATTLRPDERCSRSCECSACRVINAMVERADWALGEAARR